MGLRVGECGGRVVKKGHYRGRQIPPKKKRAEAKEEVKSKKKRRKEEERKEEDTKEGAVKIAKKIAKHQATLPRSNHLTFSTVGSCSS